MKPPGRSRWFRAAIAVAVLALVLILPPGSSRVPARSEILQSAYALASRKYPGREVRYTHLGNLAQGQRARYKGILQPGARSTVVVIGEGPGMGLKLKVSDEKRVLLGDTNGPQVRCFVEVGPLDWPIRYEAELTMARGGGSYAFLLLSDS